MDIEKLRTLAREVAKNAYSPYSQAQVGCSLFGENKYFSGCNVENCSFGATICAERNAICQAIAHGVRSFQAFYIFSKKGWTPCGVCRQCIAEFATPNTKIIVSSESMQEQSYNIDELFPSGFFPEDAKKIIKT